jgi:hypothetical protein
VQHDTAIALPYQGFVAGWAPDNGSLIFTSGDYSYGFRGPFSLFVVTDPGAPDEKVVELVDNAYHLTFGGFARTASQR